MHYLGSTPSPPTPHTPHPTPTHSNTLHTRRQAANGRADGVGLASVSGASERGGGTS